MLYEVVLYSTYFGVQCVNRWNYVSSGIPASVLASFGLLSAMGFVENAGVYPADSLFGKLRRLVSASVVFNNVTARAAADYDPEDFYELPFIPVQTGMNAGDAASPFVSYGFKTTRVRLDVARGTKRFPGVPEAYMAAGGAITAEGVGYADDMAAKMTAVLTYDDEGNTVTFNPAVVSKDEYVTPSGKRAYRYYPTLTTQLDHVAVGFQWQAYSQVRSQTSRQYGRGI